MFDPYHKWLGISKKRRPPTYYQLLGIDRGEDDPEVIDEAAVRQQTHLRTYQMGPHKDLATKLLNEVSEARSVLLNPTKRRAYEQLLAKRAAERAGEQLEKERKESAATIRASVPAAPAPTASPILAPAASQPKSIKNKSNTPVYLGIGAGVVGIVAVLVFAFLPKDTTQRDEVQTPEVARQKNKPAKKQKEEQKPAAVAVVDRKRPEVIPNKRKVRPKLPRRPKFGKEPKMAKVVAEERKKFEQVEKDADLHVVGLYEPAEAGDVVDVVVTERKNPVILVLTACESVRWRVRAERGAVVTRIMLGGVRPQKIVNETDAPVEFHTRHRPTHGISFLTHYKKDERFKRMEDDLLALTGKKVASFRQQYRYDGRPFRIESPPKVTISPTTKLHVVGFYKGPEGVRIEVKKTKHPIVLAMTSYESIKWQIDSAPGAKFEAVIVGGYESQEVTIRGSEKNVPILNCAYEGGSRLASHKTVSYASKQNDRRYDKLREQLSELTGLDIASFHGAHRYGGRPIVIPAE